jgi:hypothetical protein
MSGLRRVVTSLFTRLPPFQLPSIQWSRFRRPIWVWPFLFVVLSGIATAMTWRVCSYNDAKDFGGIFDPSSTE